jgi:hypothetical protein
LRNIGNADGGALLMKRHPGFFRSMSLSKRPLFRSVRARSLLNALVTHHSAAPRARIAVRLSFVQ